MTAVPERRSVELRRPIGLSSHIAEQPAVRRAAVLRREGSVETVVSMPDAPDSPAYPVGSVAKALEILLLLRDQQTIGVSDTSRRLGIARSTAHRLLSMLALYGFIRKDHAARYHPGPALVSLGLAAVVELDIRRCARPHLERLANEVQETVTLIGAEGSQVRFLDCMEGPRLIRVTARTGLLRPAHCTSAGKAMLARLTPEDLLRRYPQEALECLTSETIATRSELFAALDEVRDEGYATNLGESDPDLRAVGVAIPGLIDAPTAGLGISAPAERLADADIPRVAEAAMRTAQAIGDSIRDPSNG